jgi:hypothetical protein
MPAWRQSRVEHGNKTRHAAEGSGLSMIHIQITEMARINTVRGDRQP